MEHFEIQARQVYVFDPKKKTMIPKDQFEEEKLKAEEQARQNYGKQQIQAPGEKQIRHDRLIDPKSFEDAVVNRVKDLITGEIEKIRSKGLTDKEIVDALNNKIPLDDLNRIGSEDIDNLRQNGFTWNDLRKKLSPKNSRKLA